MYYVCCCGGAFSGLFALFVIFCLATAVDFIQEHWIYFVAIPGAIVGILLLVLFIKLIRCIVSSIKERRRERKWCHEHFWIIGCDSNEEDYRPYSR